MPRRRRGPEVLLGPDTLPAGPAADTLGAVDRIERIARTVDHASAHDMSDAGDRFAASLQQVALLLKADIGLRAACLDLPGWDSHIAQALSLEPLLDALGRGLATFATRLGPLLDRTSVVVLTELRRGGTTEVGALAMPAGAASARSIREASARRPCPAYSEARPCSAATRRGSFAPACSAAATAFT